MMLKLFFYLRFKSFNVNFSFMRPTQILLISFLFLAFFRGWGQVQNFTSSGTSVPPVGASNTGTTIKIECWGGGGGGKRVNIGDTYGGGGGSYSVKTYTVGTNLTISGNFTVTVGSGGSGGTTSGTNGGNSIVSGNSITVTAKGGGGALVNSAGAGGLGSFADCTGNCDDYWNGGTGNARACCGNGGGGGAGTTANGSNGNTTSGGAGGAGNPNTGTGGFSNSTSPSTNGGGGGGGVYGTTGNGGSGAAGYVRITYTIPACTALNNAGTISANQTICSGGDPAAFTSTVASGGSGGTIEYQWESSTNNVTYTDIATANSSTYDPPSGLTITTYYRRKARRCGGSWEQTTASVLVTVSKATRIAPTGAQCSGTTLNFSAEPSGATYSWVVRTNGTNSYNSSSGFVSNTSASPTSGSSSTFSSALTSTTGSNQTFYVDFSITANGTTCTQVFSPTIYSLPIAPSVVNGASRCGTGAVTISATPGIGETIDWYANSSGGTALLSSSTSYTTPSISTTTIYYAEARNTTTGCVSSNRTAVTASINLGQYRSITTGNWNNIATWEVSCDNGSTWSNATQTPTSNDGTITVRNTHTVTVAGAPTVDQVTVEPGGTVVVNTSNLTIANGADAYDFIVQGTLITTDNTVDNITETGVLYFDNGGLYINNVNTANGYGTHPTATWHLNSTCEVRGLSGPTLPNNFNQVYGNLLWNCANQGTNAVVIEQANAPTVNGTMTVANTGTTGSLVFCNTTTTGNWTTVNNLVVSGGNFYVAGVSSGFSSAVRDYKMSVNSLSLTAGSLEVGRSNNQGVYSLTVNNNATLSGGLMRVMNNSGTGARVSSFFVNGNLTISGATLDLSAIGSTNAGRVFLKGDFTMSSGSLIFSQAMTVGSSGIYFDGSTTQNFVYSGGTISTTTGGAGRRFYYKNSSGPLGINETYSSSIAQTTVNGTEGSPSNAGSYVSWPTSGSLIKNLTINNSSGVTLTTSKTVNENLNLTNGTLTTTLTNFLYLANTSSSAIVGGSSTSFVNGPLKWAVTSGGGTYTFQIGKNGKYAPAGVVNPTASSTDFMAEYFNADPNTGNYTRTSRESSINNVSACEYWMIDKVVGSASANVVLSWDVNARSCGITQPSELRVLRWESSSGGIWQNKGNNSFVSNSPYSIGTITSDQLSTFSPFTLGSTTINNPLPVTLSNFSATCIQHYIKLNWTTQSEINNDYFNVERSSDGLDFHAIGRINGNGTTNEQQDYQFIDEQTLSGINYYRLKQVDFNSASEIHPITSVVCKDNDDDIVIFPNPNNGSFEIKGLQPDDELAIYDALGKLILDKTNGKTLLNIDWHIQKSGVYFVQIKTKTGALIYKKLVVQE
jgi:hypothetical protein